MCFYMGEIYVPNIYQEKHICKKDGYLFCVCEKTIPSPLNKKKNWKQ